MKAVALLALLILAPLPGCSSAEKLNAAQEAAQDNAVAGDGADNAASAARQDGAMEVDLVRAVTIGEDGPSLDACGTNGQVAGRGHGRTLLLRAAPFTGAAARGELANGARLFICTRSVDQKWLGVVVAPPPELSPDGPPNAVSLPSVDCGVSSPVESRRPYDGPCDSGWVTASFVRLIAG